MKTDDRGSNWHSLGLVTPAGGNYLAIIRDHDVDATITLKMPGFQTEIGSKATPAFLGEKADLGTIATWHTLTEVKQSLYN
ncbi:hypothetical protein U4960_09110 [Altererythrobacter sp. H2]|nr:hypothetical protein [Altererythrobacter sp. H2]WRK94459.1 hypothetical protein U4960_09110 [Altererythrobacter sp. H2]